MLALLRDQIDITRVPFSDRGSRLLVYVRAEQSSLFIKLAERLLTVEPGIESYLKRPALIDNLVFVDERGDAFNFETSTSPEILDFKTEIGGFHLVFQDENSLVFGLPDHTTCGIRFSVRPTHWLQTEFGGALNHVRNVTYGVGNGRIIKNQILNDKDGIAVEFIVQAEADCSITLQIRDKPKLLHGNLPFTTAKEAARDRWEQWFASAPAVSEPFQKKYAYAWWVMANNLISPKGYIKYEAMMPTKAFYVGAWLWDSALHALAFRHVDPELARNQIRVMLANQLPDGMLPDVVFDEGIVAEIDHPIPGRVTKPPILAWAAMKIHEIAPNLDFLKEIYEPLKHWNGWWFEYNDDDKDGIVQYTHPYSSGLDDSPLWDHGTPVESPDINTYLFIQMESLAKIADSIGKHNDANEWRNKADLLLERMIEHLWDEKAGYFHALHDEKPIPVFTPFNLYPLWTGKLPEKLNQHLLAHLTEPASFWGRFGLSTVAYDDPAYSPDKMWRGPVWTNVNYFFVEALQKVGEQQLANELRDKTLNLIASQPGIHEYYNSRTGEPPESAAPIFGWSAATFIDLTLMEHNDKQRKGIQ